MKVLFASSEAYPFMKTGGLGDVGGSLPRALAKKGCQVRLLLPAYADTLDKARPLGLKQLVTFELEGQRITLWQTRLPGSRLVVWLVDAAIFSERAGNPYTDANGYDWPDNAWRFYLFCKVAALLAEGALKAGWRPDIVHCNDWQTGLVAPLLADQTAPTPPVVFTIHNLAYRGLFDEATFASLKLPWSWWTMDGVEFYGQFSFLKGGLVWADRITTVSPSYAAEIQTPAFGCGLEGLLQHRAGDISGIVNGIDTDLWNPGSDPYLATRYNRRSLGRKTENKTALQETFGLPVLPDKPLLGFIGRLVEQKGIALILEALPALLAAGRCQFIAIGTGQKDYQNQLTALAARYPDAVSVYMGYDEALSHQIEAGCDIFLMPSLFEPCGLNQLYSQRYGTLPVAHYVGGLRDTIVHLSQSQGDVLLGDDKAIEALDETGFLFTQPSSKSLAASINHALTCYQNKKLWRKLQLNAMSQDYSWEKSAGEYMALYEELLYQDTIA